MTAEQLEAKRKRLAATAINATKALARMAAAVPRGTPVRLTDYDKLQWQNAGLLFSILRDPALSEKRPRKKSECIAFVAKRVGVDKSNTAAWKRLEGACGTNRSEYNRVIKYHLRSLYPTDEDKRAFRKTLESMMDPRLPRVD